MRGQEYSGMKKDESGRKRPIVPRNKRIMKERCTCQHAALNKKRNCSVITEQQRQLTFDNFWNDMSWSDRKTFIRSHVHSVPVKRRRNQADNSHRSNTLCYNFLIEGKILSVCKTMFLNTLCLGEWSVRNWVMKGKKKGMPKEENDSSKKVSCGRKSASEFLSQLPKLESHYCRSSSKLLYLEPNWQSKAELHREYKKFCRDNELSPAAYKQFCEVFYENNLSLFSPKKDQCDLCCSYKAGNLPESEYSLHVDRKNEAREAKSIDKSGPDRVFTMDLQALLLSPRLQASALYYKSKLKVHNFTIYDLKTNDGYCYLWHECEGDMNASEFASIVVHFIETNIKDDDSEIILYSDGCTYQNRNSIMSNALAYLAKEKGITITQKFLEKGYTQMECDSMHAIIEKRLRNRQIYTPAGYVEVCATARQKPKPYVVTYLDHTFFKAFNKLALYSSIRPGSRPGEPTVTDIRCLKYDPSGGIEYKLKFSDTWQTLPRRMSNVNSFKVPALYSSQLKIKAEKYAHLQQLKAVIPKDYHSFYDNLPVLNK